MSKIEQWLWEERKPPSEAGWYAVLICWEPREGIFPIAMFSDGQKWESNSPVCARGKVGPFPTKEAAHDWAYENDPEL